ncbi:hypothetical protein [Deinococcus multiflagellatus]|uniref:Uncharacterized protein n=1 Tax=Deinococcus multiflagellatus TaxID=1656887 RepID=A0ABW1ZPB3_9DEIO
MHAHQTAYLVTHLYSIYEDEYYTVLDADNDLTVANPAGLYADREQAEAAVRQLTRQALRGAGASDLLLDEEQSGLFAELEALVDEPLASVLATKAGDALPQTLTDEQADQIIGVLNLTLFGILEAPLTAAELMQAQAELAQTPERPFAAPAFDERGKWNRLCWTTLPPRA